MPTISKPTRTLKKVQVHLVTVPSRPAPGEIPEGQALQARFTLASTEDFNHRLPDMLRYDRAFIHDNLPGVALTFDVHTRNLGLSRGSITERRWASFGARISPVRLEAYTLENILAQADRWYTFRRNSRTDELVRTTLAQYLTSTIA